MSTFGTVTIDIDELLGTDDRPARGYAKFTPAARYLPDVDGQATVIREVIKPLGKDVVSVQLLAGIVWTATFERIGATIEPVSFELEEGQTIDIATVTPPDSDAVEVTVIYNAGQKADQSALVAEATARSAADSALDARLDTAEALTGSGRLSEASLDADYAAKRAFYPEQYGADNTGVTNSRNAIQAAIDAARDAGGGTVIIDGTYRVDTSLLPRSNVTLEGRGWGRSILKAHSSWASNTSLLEVGGSSGSPIENFTVRGIKLDLSAVSATYTCKGIFVTYMRNFRFENNWVYQSTATGIGADFLDKSVIRGNRVEGCGRKAVGAEDATLGCSGIGIGTGVWGDEATLVEGNFVIGAVRYGIFVEYQNGISTHLTSGVKILNNHVTGARWGIGSNGAAWAHVTGNSVEASTRDGISITPGNAGANSYGDLIAHNTVRTSGRHGIVIDLSAATSASEPDSGKYMIVNNRFVSNTSCGIKIITSEQEAGFQIHGNRISNNGSIGLDIAGGGLKESDILNNRIVDNTGIGLRVLGALLRVKISGNRSGDTRASGRTQTYGIEVTTGITVTDVVIEDNDLTNNQTASLSVAGTVAGASVIRRNRGFGPDAPASMTVTASPMTYTVGARPEQLWVIGGTWTSIQIAGQTVLTGPGTLMAEPNDVVTFTYTGAPTAIKRRII